MGAASPSHRKLMYYVYVLKSQKNGSLYIGYTDDLKRRFEEHNNLKSQSTKYKAPFEIVYYEAYKSSYYKAFCVRGG